MEKLNANIKDVQLLIKGGGSPAKERMTRKAAIVLFTACWEAFIEDLATVSFKFLLKKCTTHRVVPGTVKSLSVTDLHSAKDPLGIWSLAGSGWKTVLRKHSRQSIKRYVDNMNTPDVKHIDEMFKSLIGMKNISHNWQWRGNLPEFAKNKLGRYLTLRGDIAHRIASDNLISTKMVNDYVDFIFRLAVKSNNAVRSHLFKVTKKYPWTSYSFGHTN